MENIVTFENLLRISKSRKSHRTFYELKGKFSECFTGDIGFDIAKANGIINSTTNNGTAHSYTTTVKWAYQIFYGVLFEPKMIVQRTKGISKFTSRLEYQEIQLVRTKFKEWIETFNPKVVTNHIDSLKNSRLRIYHSFECLLASGMRIGELAGLNFQTHKVIRVIQSEVCQKSIVEIIINTEKTCKKREVWLPTESWNFLVNDNRKYGNKTLQTLTTGLITAGFIEFAKWAKLPFKLTAHVLRRTKATLMHEASVNVEEIAMVLGNTPRTVMEYYIISSGKNKQASEIAIALADGKIKTAGNMFLNLITINKI